MPRRRPEFVLRSDKPRDGGQPFQRVGRRGRDVLSPRIAKLSSLTGGERVRPKFDAPRTLVEGVAAHLRELILKGGISPGERLNELRLAHELSLSRSPIREAFRMLAVEGLVAITPRRGVWVRPISLDELRDVFEMRSLFELFALTRSDRSNATERAHMRALLRTADAMLEQGDVEGWYESSQAFHDAIIDSARNRQLKALYDLLKLSMRRYQLMVIGLPRHPHRSQAEHQAIFDALARGNTERACDLLRAHLKRVRDTLAGALDEGRTEAHVRRQRLEEAASRPRRRARRRLNRSRVERRE